MTWSLHSNPDRQPFEPAGDVGLRLLVHAGLRTLQPLEPGTVITHEQISEWLGEPFPRHNSYGERDYWPMDAIKIDLLKQQNLLLIPTKSGGYVVATDAQMVDYAERRGVRKAIQVLDHAGDVLRAARPDRLTPAERRLRDHLEIEARETNRLLRSKHKAFTHEESKWET